MFKEIFKHLDKLKVNMTIQKDGNELIVSVIPTIKKGEEAVNNAIPPFTVKGTPEELDESFHTTFASAAVFLEQKVTDIEVWKKQAEEAAGKSKAAKELKDKKEKEQQEKKNKAKKQIELGDAQFKEKKYDAAKLYYREALSIVGGKDASIEKKIAECDKLTGNVGLFGATETPAINTADEDNNDSDTTEELDEEQLEEAEEKDDDWT